MMLPNTFLFFNENNTPVKSKKEQCTLGNQLHSFLI